MILAFGQASALQLGFPTSGPQIQVRMSNETICRFSTNHALCHRVICESKQFSSSFEPLKSRLSKGKSRETKAAISRSGLRDQFLPAEPRPVFVLSLSASRSLTQNRSLHPGPGARPHALPTDYRALLHPASLRQVSSAHLLYAEHRYAREARRCPRITARRGTRQLRKPKLYRV